MSRWRRRTGLATQFSAVKRVRFYSSRTIMRPPHSELQRKTLNPMLPNSRQLLSSMRLQRSRDFAEIYAGRCTAGDAHMLVFARRSLLPHTRFGLSISRRHGGAVIRNRKRRLLREAFRLHRTELPEGLDLILIPRQRLDSQLTDYSRSLVRLVAKLHRTLPPRDKS